MTDIAPILARLSELHGKGPCFLKDAYPETPKDMWWPQARFASEDDAVFCSELCCAFPDIAAHIRDLERERDDAREKALAEAESACEAISAEYRKTHHATCYNVSDDCADAINAIPRAAMEEAIKLSRWTTELPRDGARLCWMYHGTVIRRGLFLGLDNFGWVRFNDEAGEGTYTPQHCLFHPDTMPEPPAEERDEK